MCPGVRKAMRAHIVSGLLLLLSLAFPAQAADGRGGGTPSLERILPEIRRSTPGTFYDAEGPFADPSGKEVYRIKWMTPDGRIIWFDADARTGRILTPMQGGSRPGGGADRFGNGPPRRYDGDDRSQSGNYGDRDWGRDRDGNTWRRDRDGGKWGPRGGENGRGGPDRD